MTPDELTADARKKMLAIESARQEADDMAQAAGRRLRQLSPHSTDPAVVQMGEQLIEKRDRFSQRFDELNVLLNKIKQFLRELPPGVVLEVAPPVRTKLRDDEKVASAIARVRLDILSCKQDLAAAQNAPLPVAELKRLVAARVLRMKNNGAPNLTVDGGKLVLWFTDPRAGDSRCELNEVARLLAWFDADRLTARLADEIDALGEPQNPLTPEAKEKKLAELTARMNDLERSEEALVENAQAQGMDVMRRADASPAAVLGIVVKAAAQAQAAAA
jgi:hypothetical protein